MIGLLYSYSDHLLILFNITSAVVFSQKCLVEGNFGNFFHWYLCRNRYKVCVEYENVMKRKEKKRKQTKKTNKKKKDKGYNKSAVCIFLLVNVDGRQQRDLFIAPLYGETFDDQTNPHDLNTKLVHHSDLH